MKIGDTFPVSIQGIQVTQAVVEGLDAGTVTLVFEGQRVVLATRTELTDDSPRTESGTQHIITGADRASNSEVKPEAPTAPPAPATVPEPPAQVPAPVTPPEKPAEAPPESTQQ